MIPIKHASVIKISKSQWRVSQPSVNLIFIELPHWILQVCINIIRYLCRRAAVASRHASFYLSRNDLQG